MDWSSTTTAYAAIYAAVVATGALALEIRRWFESGPRLLLTVMPEAQVYGGDYEDINVYLHVRVTNRGALPTTVTNFAVHEYRTLIHRWVKRASKSAIVPHPQNCHPLPYILHPGMEWGGSTTYDDDLRAWAQNGKLFVAIYHSQSSRPIQKKVRLARKERGKLD